MNSKEYDTIKKDELASVYSGFSISQEMQNAVKNEMWKSKYGLWTILSASCDSAGEKCKEYIHRFAEQLIDIDTCNVHALKSIAESVDLGFLCNWISEEYPEEIMDLINLFSISKNTLLDTNKILSEKANGQYNGAILKRTAAELDASDFTLNLLFDIKKNTNHIKKILNTNMIFTSKKLRDLVKKETLGEMKKFLITWLKSGEQLNVDLRTASNPAIDMNALILDLVNKMTVSETDTFAQHLVDMISSLSMNEILSRINDVNSRRNNRVRQEEFHIENGSKLHHKIR